MISLEKNLKINIKRIKKQETYNTIELWLMTENPVTRLDGSRTRQILYSYNAMVELTKIFRNVDWTFQIKLLKISL